MQQIAYGIIEADATTENLSTSLKEAAVTIEKLEKENKALHSYIKELGQDLQFENTGGTVQSVGERQQRRNIKI